MKFFFLKNKKKYPKKIQQKIPTNKKSTKRKNYFENLSKKKFFLTNKKKSTKKYCKKINQKKLTEKKNY